MIDLDAFHTLAEVSITFTGLAGVVSVVGRSRLTPEGRQWRIWNMILLSLVAFFACLIPIALDLFSLQTVPIWTVCSISLVTAQMSQSFFAYRAGQRISRVASELMIQPLIAIYIVGSAIIGILQLVNVLVISPGPALYFLGICWFIFLSSMHFFVLVMSSDLRSSEEAT
jgi:hypothetical protein